MPTKKNNRAALAANARAARNAPMAPAPAATRMSAGGKPRRLVYKPEVLDRVGRSYTTIWAWMNEGKFPQSVMVGAQVAWHEHEIDEWIDARPHRQRTGDPKAVA